MNAGDLHKLSRLLREVAVAATTEPGEARVAMSVLAVAEDLAANPDSTIGAVAVRTGLAQSAVSTAIAELRDRGVVDAAPDPQDRRRTLVRLNARRKRALIDPRGARAVTGALADALPERTPAQLRRIERLLDQLALAVLD